MSDTPRTDKNTNTTDWITGCMVVTADFARQLERELTAAKEHWMYSENEAIDAAADARRSRSLLWECLVVIEEDAPRLIEIEALAQRVRAYLEDDV